MGVVVIVGTDRGGFFCRSDAAREDWSIEGPHFKGWKVTAAAKTPGGRYLVATASQVYGAALHRSADLKEWKQIEKGPAYPEDGGKKLNQIWSLEAAHGRVYAGVDSAGLFVSEDDGEHWQPVPGLNDHETSANWFPGAGGLCLHSIVADPGDPDRLWCGISAVGVWRTDDGGATWKPKNDGVPVILEDKQFKEIGFCVHRIVADPDDANTIYRQDHAGMFKSSDGGDSWQRNANGLPSNFGFPLALEPRTKRLFAFPLESDEFRMPAGGSFRIYRSTDGGASWEPCAEGLPSQPTWAGVLRGCLAVDGLEPGGVYAGSTGGHVFVSTDAGDTWRALPCSLPRILSVSAYSGD